MSPICCGQRHRRLQARRCSADMPPEACVERVMTSPFAPMGESLPLAYPLDSSSLFFLPLLRHSPLFWGLSSAAALAALAAAHAARPAAAAVTRAFPQSPKDGCILEQLTANMTADP